MSRPPQWAWLALCLSPLFHAPGPGFPRFQEPRSPSPERRVSAEEDEFPEAARATRLDLSRALLDFERAVRDSDARAAAAEAALRGAEDRAAAAEVQGRLRIDIARGFDSATLAFFLGDGTGALCAIRDLEHRLRPMDPGTRLGTALSARCEPQVLVAGAETPLELVWDFFRAVDAASAPAQVEFRVHGPLGGPASQEAPGSPKSSPPDALVLRLSIGDLLAGSPEGRRAPLPLATPPLEGRYEVRVGGATVASFHVLPSALGELRERLLERLSTLEQDPTFLPGLASARLCAVERAKLLVEVQNPARSAEFQADLARLSREIEAEVSALEAGRDPYRRRPGDVWRALPREPGRRGRADVLPLRVFAPACACGDQPSALVIALHGAGGDENMFFDAYDLGRLKDLAAERGFLLASPANVFFGAAGERAMVALIEQLSRDYAVDPARVYLIGHSMGAGAASSLAEPLAGRIAAVACLAGGAFSKSAAAAPVLALAGEADGVVPAKLTRASAERAAAAGARVEFRLFPQLGHLTLVGPALPPAVDWLLRQRR